MDFGLGFLTAISLWPAIIIILLALILFPLVIYETTGVAVLVVGLALAILQLVFHYDIIGYIYNNPGAIAAWAGLYVIVGAAYSFIRWEFYCQAWGKRYDQATTTFVKKAIWADRPAAASSKNRITTWMTFWPWSLFWWVFSDLITKVFEYVYNRFAGIYTMIAERHIKKRKAPGEE